MEIELSWIVFFNLACWFPEFYPYTGCNKYVLFGLGYCQVKIFLHSELNREL